MCGERDEDCLAVMIKWFYASSVDEVNSWIPNTFRFGIWRDTQGDGDGIDHRFQCSRCGTCGWKLWMSDAKPENIWSTTLRPNALGIFLDGLPTGLAFAGASICRRHYQLLLGRVELI